MGLYQAIKSFWEDSAPPFSGSASDPQLIVADAYPALTLEQRMERLDSLMSSLNEQGGIGYTRYGLNTVPEIRRAFVRCAPLPTIVSQKAWAFTRGKVVVWNPATGKPVRGQFKEWERLFQNPNADQSQRQFFTQAYTYCQKFGYCIINPSYPAGFNDRPSELRVIPNWQFEYLCFNGEIVAAYWNRYGIREELNVDRLVIISDSASQDYDESTGLPYSRARVLEGEVSNIAAALNARGNMITDRGMQGLMTNRTRDQQGHMPMQATERAELEFHYNSGGVLKGQKKIKVTDADVDYIPTTFNSQELQLQEESITCLKTICNRYGFPFNSLAEGFSAKYNNSTNSRRDFQDNTIEPESLDFFEQLSQGLGLYKENCEAYMDYSGVASLQQSQKEMGDGKKSMADAMQVQWDLGTVTRNDIREALGQDPIAKPEFDKYKWELTPQELGAVTSQNNSNGNQAAAVDSNAADGTQTTDGSGTASATGG